MGSKAGKNNVALEAFCYNCGYSLRGLDLPHVCPECGQMADPEKQAAEARAWFASWRVWFWWWRPSRAPTGACYVLHDAESVRIARRRGLLCLWLPAVLCFAVVIGASAVVVQNTYITRMYNGARPSRPVVTFEWAGDETVLGVRGWRRNRKIQPQEVQDEFLIQFQKTRCNIRHRRRFGCRYPERNPRHNQII